MPESVRLANAMLDNSIEVAEAACEHGGEVMFESPVSRDAGSPHSIEGREDHASMWSYPALNTFAARQRMRGVTFDRCRTGLKWQKTTYLLATPRLASELHLEFAHLVCDHGEHKVLPGPRGADDKYESEESAEYSGEMCARIARSIRRTVPTADAQAAPATAAVEGERDPIADWAAFYEAETNAPPLAYLDDHVGAVARAFEGKLESTRA